MKRSNFVFKVVAALFFLAVLAYIGIYLYRSLDDPFRTTPAQSYTIYDSVSTSGIIIRDELTLYSDYDIVYVSADEAKRVPSGGEIAVAYLSQQDLERAMEIRQIQAQVNRMEHLKEGGILTNDPLQFNAQMEDNILRLKQSANTRDMSAVEDIAISINTLAFFDRDGPDNVEQTLAALYAELSALSSVQDQGAAEIYAPQSGLFSSFVDGYENITLSDLKRMSPFELDSIIKSEHVVPEKAFGKIVCGIKWYFAANLKPEEAKSLTVGETADLIFGVFLSDPLAMTVEHVSVEDNGYCTVIFSCSKALADTINIRKQSAEILENEYSGIRVPKNAIRLNDEGKACVYVVVAGLQIREKLVDIIHDAGDFYIVRSETDRMNALRPGDVMVTSAKNLYDGKVLG